MAALRDGSSAAGPAIAEPGELERRARRAGLEPREAGEVDVPFVAPDLAALQRAFLNDSIGSSLSEDEVRRRVTEAARPYRRDDGSYRFENRFRWVVAEA